ncbi:hypothetical protein M406DRAFT_349669 [Cryphonectria parasitica EP155]|uniref:BZIP domain-containing protein n=1 Tax=Cryphonectria parasitica (strain ATCC 38755 / EP155) TaxID=660469 RepID=A0A9P4YFP8_CRYP1|nr:uncharacterized protein M406DRAFT_349669 [Cryphonectria parasitica EP155]KAF3771360.1 hypothetical protein M406DRAFT_349669 [Cryphonectria parasitica EP155]
MSMASVISPMPGPPAAKAPISMTSKEWVIPPRPKPGRKPATDTPPTKRKAQNRAAQRAFRERRAARVGELEEQLEAEKEEHESSQRALQEKVHRLEMDAQALQSRCEVLENMLDKERAERSKEVEALKARLQQATAQAQQHPRQQSLPSLASVPPHTFAPQPLRHHRPSAPSRSHGGRASTSSLTRLTPNATHRPATTHSFSISQIISPPEDIEQAPTGCGNCEPTGPCACAEEAMTSVNVGCGNCTLGSRCQCLEEVLNGEHTHSNSNSEPGSRMNSLSGTKPTASRTAKRTMRSISPSSMAPEEKRPRGSLTLATETDFTAMFSRKAQHVTTSMSQPQLPTPAAINPAANHQMTGAAPTPYSLATLAPMEPQAVESPRPEDRCGFCEDGTYCVCAEAAAAAAAAANNAADTAPTESLTLPAIHSSTFSVSRPGQQTRTPPPSEGDAIGYEILPDGSVKLPSLKGLHARNKAMADSNTLPRPSGGGCGSGGPGTCAQCLADPKSGLFCRSLAANFKKNGESSGGCCGGGGAGGCCKDRNNTSANADKPGIGLSLSCADAYKTLSSHKHFSEAADDINTWLPLLRAAPKPREPALGKDGSSRTPIEVEAASIMSVLKGFDVRFGRGE